jgi:drug/metabolite transporter (DMT)-like permease
MCWGANSVFAKLAVGRVSPMLLVSLRWFGAVCLLLIISRNLLARDWNVLKEHRLMLFFMGALGFATFNALFYVAAYTTTALNIGIIQGSIPVFVLLGMFILYKAPVSKLQAIGVSVTMVGVCIVASAGNIERLYSLHIERGDYYMILACFLYAGYAVGLKRFSGVSSLSLFTVIAFVAFLTSIPMSFTEYLLGNLQWPTGEGWIIVALVTFFPSFLAQICFIQGVAAIGPGRAGVFVNLVPVFAAILAVTILQEPFNMYHGVALALVISGIWLSERGK